MNPESTLLTDDLQRRLIISLDKVAEWAEKTESFAIEQAPLVVKEIIDWEFYSNLSIAVLLLVLALVLCFVSILLYRAIKYRNLDDGFFIPIVIMILASLASSVFAVEKAYNAARVSVQPRIVLLEKLGVIPIKLSK